MFFHKSRDYKRPPIELAYMLMYGAMNLLYSYMRNKNIKISAEELNMVDLFVEELHNNYITAQHISACLHKRSKPETREGEDS